MFCRRKCFSRKCCRRKCCILTTPPLNLWTLSQTAQNIYEPDTKNNFIRKILWFFLLKMFRNICTIFSFKISFVTQICELWKLRIKVTNHLPWICLKYIIYIIYMYRAYEISEDISVVGREPKTCCFKTRLFNIYQRFISLRFWCYKNNHNLMRFWCYKNAHNFMIILVL